jgi:hypothetical protein
MNARISLIAAALLVRAAAAWASGQGESAGAAQVGPPVPVREIPTAALDTALAAPDTTLGTSPADELDAAIREASDYLNNQLPKGNKLVILNVQSDFPALSEYIIDELIANTVNDRVFSVVDRQQLNTIRAELDFQTSGEVSDESAQSIGQILGAQNIVSGAVSKIGDLYRLRVRALNVQTAAIEGQFNRNIPDNPTLAALVKSRATGYGGTPPASASASAAAPAGQASPPSAPAPGEAAPPTPAQDPAADTRPGLFADGVYQGDMDLYDMLDWITLNAKSGGNYTIALGKDAAVAPAELDYGGKTVAITLKSADGKRTVGFDGKSPAYSLFTVGAGVVLTLEDGVTLRGAENSADKSLVRVSGGRFVMAGGAISGNKTSGSGGGVSVLSGTFTMAGGTISGNTANYFGGGVYVKTGAFTMSGGTINGNAAGNSGLGGGGVSMDGGTFTMAGGTICGNTAGNGGGVYMGGGTFTMNDGTISGNTASSYGGGGVFMGSNATFAMSGGAIGGNTAGDRGGGVYMESGKFTMSGGAIGGNTANGSGWGGGGGGVYMGSGAFTKSAGAVIYGSNAPDQANSARDDSRGHAVYVGGKKRNTTARAATVMDSTKDGPSGGWE